VVGGIEVAGVLVACVEIAGNDGMENHVGAVVCTSAKIATVQNPSAARGMNIRKIERRNPRTTAATMMPPYRSFQSGRACSKS
jgi:hypothetical protein